MHCKLVLPLVFWIYRYTNVVDEDMKRWYDNVNVVVYLLLVVCSRIMATAFHIRHECSVALYYFIISCHFEILGA